MSPSVKDGSWSLIGRLIDERNTPAMKMLIDLSNVCDIKRRISDAILRPCHDILEILISKTRQFLRADDKYTRYALTYGDRKSLRMLLQAGALIPSRAHVQINDPHFTEKTKLLDDYHFQVVADSNGIHTN